MFDQPVFLDFSHHVRRDLVAEVAAEANCHGEHVARLGSVSNFATSRTLGVDKGASSA